MRRWSKSYNRSRAERELARWRETSTLLGKVVGDRSLSTSRSLAQVRLPSQISRRSDKHKPSPVYDSSRSDSTSDKLRVARKETSVKSVARTVTGKELYYEDGTPRDRLLFKGIYSTKADRGLASCNRFVSPKSIVSDS